MSSESNLLEYFKLLLGDKYKIVPLSDEEKSTREDSGTRDKTYDNDATVDFGDEDYTNTDNETIDENYDENDDNDDNPSVSEEARALFERDRQKYGITTNKNDNNSISSNEKQLIEEAQAMYDRVVENLDGLISTLENSKYFNDMYITILRGNDMDDPYREQLAAPYAPRNRQEEAEYYKRIRRDPFYGRLKLSSEDGKIVDIYIGNNAYNDHGAGISIISPWGEIGKAFRRNVAGFYLNGVYHKVINKYTYITKNGKIIGVKDESPR